MKKWSLIVVLFLAGLMLASVAFAADYYGVSRYGTYYEYPRFSYGQPTTGYYSGTDYYPERYYYQTAPYDYTRYLYRYGGVSTPTTVLEQPSYLGFYSRFNSGAVEGQLCGILQNRFYDCAGGYFCAIKENYIGVCEKQSLI